MTTIFDVVQKSDEKKSFKNIQHLSEDIIFFLGKEDEIQALSFHFTITSSHILLSL